MLFIWAKENSDISYRQGMHELLSPILLVLYRDAQIVDNLKYLNEVNPNVNHILKILDRTYLEHDTYCLFEKLMSKMKEFFIVESSQIVKAPKRGIATNSPLDSVLLGPQKVDENDTPIFKICNKIQYTLLEKKDPELHRHLIRMAIEPQVYLLRWVRLLFGREFHIDDSIILWDAIFADCGGFRSDVKSPSDIDLSLVEHISVAMLHYIRKHLLTSDCSNCLRRLMRYPPVEDVHIFVEQALESRTRPTSLLPGMESMVVEPVVTVKHTNTSSLFPRLSRDVKVTEKSVKSSNFFPSPPKKPGLLSPSKSNGKHKVKPLSGTPTIQSMSTSHHGHSFEAQEYIEKEKKLGTVVDVVLNVLQNMILE